MPTDELIPPVRGLVPYQNAKGRPYRITDVHRWMRLNRLVFRVEKVDLLLQGAITRSVCDLIWWCSAAQEVTIPLNLAVSLRTECRVGPDLLDIAKKSGLFDVFLTPPRVDAPNLDLWFEACRRMAIPVRLQVQPPFPAGEPPGKLAGRIANASVKAVNIVVSDPFVGPARTGNRLNSQAAIAYMNDLAAALDGLGIEANLYGMPLCLIREENRGRAGSNEQFFLDHQQYAQRAYELAAALYRRPTHIASLAVAATLGRYTSFRNPVDEFLLEWMVTKHPRLHFYALLLRKLTRHLRLRTVAALPAADSQEALEQAAARAKKQAQRNLDAECRRCSLRRICGHETRTFKRRLPGISVKAQSGELCLSPFSRAVGPHKYYDVIDAERRGFTETQQALARKAHAIVTSSSPDRQFGFHHYFAENSYHLRMPGAVRWYSVTSNEVLSTVFCWKEAPLTVAVTFGGGIADYVGFSLGRSTKLLCPMVGFSHRVTLHIEADGQYVLLRDGEVVRPVELEGIIYLPRRLPSSLPFRFSMWNIEGAVCTQNLLVWEGNPAAAAARQDIKYSIIMVSTRFARRLQAVLLAVAHQEAISLQQIEVIVGYVPGIDATDDVLNSIQSAFPGLRIVRSTFPEQKINAKGFIINESVAAASGEWIILLDSDIVIPPNFFAEMEKAPAESMSVAPAGRKMLPHDVTAQILLGERQSWRDWESLVNGPGEGRYGDQREGGSVPVGFCQGVRRSCFEKVRYNEYDHFEGADWEFGNDIRNNFGECAWLEVPVLHLDHGGSQWYGAQKHQ